MYAKNRNTPYAQYVFANVKEFVRAGQGMYRYDEIASGVGLKPTHNFRRRINEMVADGILVLCPTFTPRGGIENRFMIASSPEAEVHPF